MLSHLKEYFTFSRTERRGIIVFMGIILILVLVIYSLEYILPQKQRDFTAFQAQIDSFYFACTMAEQIRTDSLNKIYKNKFEKNKSTYNSSYKSKNYNQGTLPFSSFKEKGMGDEVKKTDFRNEDIIELNSADSMALMKLKGIGKIFASRILKYREMLGGFAFKEQLKEVYGVDSLLYNTIEGFITVNHAAIQKININFADAQTLSKHPYLKYTKANAILYYRKQAGNFESIEDIRNAIYLTDEEYKKLEPYLTLN